MWEDFSSLIYLATYILDLRVVSIRRNSDSEAELDSPTWLDLGFLTKKQKVKKFGGDPLFFFRIYHTAERIRAVQVAPVHGRAPSSKAASLPHNSRDHIGNLQQRLLLISSTAS